MYEEQWRIFAKNNFPREVRGRGDWIVVKNEEEYLSFLKERFSLNEPAHTSLYPASTPNAWSRFWVDTLLFEIDAPNIMDSYADMRLLVEKLEKEYSTKPRVYFSGHRSFHVYIDFAMVVIDKPMERLKRLAMKIAGQLWKHVDANMFTERHLIRVPYTINEKTGYLAIGVDPSWDLHKIAQYSIKKAPEEFPIKGVSYSHEILVRLLDTNLPKPKPAKRVAPKKEGYEWIEKLMQHPVADGRHRLLWHVIAPYLMNVLKLDYDEAFQRAMDYFNRCNEVRRLDPSPVQFRSQIKANLRHFQKDSFGPWRLETIKEKDPQLYEIIMNAIGSP